MEQLHITVTVSYVSISILKLNINLQINGKNILRIKPKLQTLPIDVFLDTLGIIFNYIHNITFLKQ